MSQQSALTHVPKADDHSVFGTFLYTDGSNFSERKSKSTVFRLVASAVEYNSAFGMHQIYGKNMALQIYLHKKTVGSWSSVSDGLKKINYLTNINLRFR